MNMLEIRKVLRDLIAEAIEDTSVQVFMDDPELNMTVNGELYNVIADEIQRVADAVRFGSIGDI